MVGLMLCCLSLETPNNFAWGTLHFHFASSRTIMSLVLDNPENASRTSPSLSWVLHTFNFPLDKSANHCKTFYFKIIAISFFKKSPKVPGPYQISLRSYHWYHWLCWVDQWLKQYLLFGRKIRFLITLWTAHINAISGSVKQKLEKQDI